MSYTRYCKFLLCLLFIPTCFGQATCFPLNGVDNNHPNGLFLQFVPSKQYSGPRQNSTSTYLSPIPQGAGGQVLWDAMQGPHTVTSAALLAAIKTELTTCVPKPATPPTQPPQPVPFYNTPLAAGSHVTVVADFNRDGTPDLALVTPGGNQLSIYLGNQDGTFQKPANTQIGNASTRLSAIALSDFNGDRKLDLAIVDTGNNAVYVMYGKGDGTFFGKADGPFAPVTIPVGHAPVAIAVADVNNDGIPDIAVANSADNTISVARGLGNGTFIPASSFAVGTTPVALIAQDLNADGNVDLVVGDNGSSDVAVLHGLGTGGFQGATFTKTPAPPTYMSSADFNNDGVPDLAVLAGDLNAVMMFTGGFQGKLTLAGTFLVPNLSASFVINDFDGDGNLDLLVPDTDSGSTVLLLGRGDGTLNAPSVYGGSRGLTSIAAGDFHNSGKLDLIVTGSNSTSSTLSILAGMGNGQFQPPANIPVSGRTDVVAVGDFNKDGRLDIAVSGAQLNILMGQGNGSFTQGAQYANLVPSVVADFNKDGRLDIAGPFNGSLGVMLGNGDGTFRSAAALSVGSNPITAATADFNRDGAPDIAVLNGGTPGVPADPGGVGILLGNGTGTFPSVNNVAAGSNPVALAVGDLNGDGKPDLVVASHVSGAGTVFVMLGKGDGTFLPPFTIPLPAGENANTLALVDLDADGNPDIVVGDCCTDATTFYFRGNGDGTFQPVLPFYGGNNVRAIAVGDWNGDGKPDLAMAYSPAAKPALSGIAPLVNHLGVMQAMTITSGASFLPGPIAPDSIVTLFGTSLTTGTAAPAADASSLPTTLADTSVTIKDSEGIPRMAQLYYVSPAQMNLLVPAATAIGAATISITAPNGVTAAPVNVIATAPGLFTAGTTSFPAGSGVIVHSGNQSGFNITYTDPVSGNVTPLAINMGTRLDQVFLTLYGTGFRNRSSLDAVSITIGNATAGPLYTPALYAGPQSQYPGLDQLNFLVPFALAGAGQVTINVSVNGAQANPVNVVIQ